MAQAKDTGASGSSAAPAPAVQARADGTVATASQPAQTYRVVTYKTKDKKKRRYSKNLKTMQEFERGFARAGDRVADAVAKGMERYRERSKESARKRKDGALVDFVSNLGKAAGKTARIASRAPNDFLKRANSKRVSKQVRDSVKVLMPPIFR